ncbi:MAG: DNA gyrase/topoisomerase IV subunit A, partial [Bacteroidaceae bacterium]|nr:DNA gyrase/topoisomerase IV subunit A [Bacteroidaceae bacterium]
TLEANARRQNCFGENKDNELIWFSETPFPRIQVMFGGNDNFREPLVIEVDEFIATKSFKAKGKRLTTYEIDEIIELEPTKFPPPPEMPDEPETDSNPNDDEPEQLTLFDGE